MSAVEPVAEDGFIEWLGYAEKYLKLAEFPRLVEEEITDDGETYMALRCPRCGGSISEGGELFAHGIGWTAEENEQLDNDSFDHQRIPFGHPDRPDTDTLFITHGDNPGHAVSLPEGWTVDWS